MSITITAESKNSLSLTNEAKQSDRTWNESLETWDESTGTWEIPGTIITRESKNALTITNESKN